MHHYPPTQVRSMNGVDRQFNIVGTVVYDRSEYSRIGIDDADVDAYPNGAIVPLYKLAGEYNSARYTAPLWSDWWYLYGVTDQIIPIPSETPADNSYQSTSAEHLYSADECAASVRQPEPTQGATAMTSTNTFTVQNGDGVEVEVHLPMYPEYDHAWLNVVMNWGGACYSGKSDFIRDMMDSTESRDQLYLQNQRAVEMVADDHPHCLEEFVEHLLGEIIVPEPEVEQWHPKCGDVINDGWVYFYVLTGSGDETPSSLVRDDIRDTNPWWWVGIHCDSSGMPFNGSLMTHGSYAANYTKYEV